MKDMLTVVLTLKDRAAYTFRWMEYADRVALPFKVLIADGGADPDVSEGLAKRERFPHVDYEYVRYPYDASYSDYYAKMAGAVSRVRTPYAVLADNDDFFIVPGVMKAIEFLEAHRDCVACGGQRAAFWIAGGGEGGAGLYGDVEWKLSSNSQRPRGATARERVRDQSLNADDIFYHVMRAPEMARRFAKLEEFNPGDLFLMEHLISYLCAIDGGIRQLDTLYIARQQDSPGSSGGEHQRKFGGWWGRMLVPTWSRDFAKFVEITAAELARADAIDAQEAAAWIVKSYRLAVAPSLLSDILEEETITPSMPAITQLVRKTVALPETSVVKRALRSLYRRARWISFDAVYATQLVARPASNAAREFAAVREFLSRAHSRNPTSGT